MSALPYRRRRAAHRGVASTIAFLLGVVLLAGLPVAAGAGAVTNGLYTGYDISWPQCPKGVGNGQGQPLPTTHLDVVTIGLTNGLGLHTNPCLPSLWDWANSNADRIGFYTVASYPTGAELDAASNGPYGACPTGFNSCRLRTNGYQQAQYALSTVAALGQRAPMIWVDVEPRDRQPWSGDTGANTLVLQGIVDGLRAANEGVGFYSYPTGWNEITGGWDAPGPEWYPLGGAHDLKYDACQQQRNFAGGPTWMTQSANQTYDFDLVCPSAVSHLDEMFVRATGGPSVVPPPVVTAMSGRFSPISARRILDTRSGLGVSSAGRKSGPVTLTLPASVPADASAVALNVTVTDATGDGYLTAYPGGTTRPYSSNLNYARGVTQANLVTVPVTAGRQVVLHVIGSPLQLIADLVGSFRAGSGAGYVPMTAQRAVDSRLALGVPATGPVSGTTTITLPASVPADATAAALNVTVTEATAPGYAVAYPAGQSPPGTSNVNYLRGGTQANLVLTPLGPGRTLAVFTSAPTELVIDVDGYFTATGGSALAAATPRRVLDTRIGIGATPGPRRGELVVSVPGLPAGTVGVLVNVTATAASAAGYVTAYPTGSARPHTSNVNFTPGRTQANLVVVPVTASSQLSLYVGGGPTQLVADVAGYLLP